MKKSLAFALAASILVPSAIPAAAAPVKPIKVESIEFKGMDAPKTIKEMSQTYTKASVEITYSNGSKRVVPLSYNKLFKSEDVIAQNKGKLIPAGTPIDVKGNPIVDPSATGKNKYFVSDSPDANSVMKVGNNIYMVTHYEYQTIAADGQSTYGVVPASMSLSKLKQDKTTGKLSVQEVNKIDFKDVNGIWIPCNGTLSPWNTHLGSEEYEPDARAFETDPESSAATFTKSFAKLYFGEEKKANPYFYGWIPEITVKENGSTKVVKHYSTGRFSHELMQMMPDNRTAFFGDDGGNTMMFMYVADKAKDLSSGTLYASKFSQTGTENGGTGRLTWIKLGHATDKEVKSIIDKGTKFSDIFETAEQETAGFTAIKTYPSNKVEYLKVKPGMEKAAAFLEPRRYAAMLGATSEWNKMEGLAVNQKDKKLYVAMSYVEKGMEKDSTEKDPADDIQLPKIKAGVTYELSLIGNQKDKSGKSINSNYVASSLKGLVVGEDLPGSDAYGNTANPNKVANPDNLTFSDDMRTLFIGEDSGLHINNFVWAYNIDTKKLTRIQSVPAGAEATGLRYVGQLNGHSYIMSNFQHPGDELDNFDITAVNREDLKAEIDKEIGINKTGGVGYISGVPTLQSGQTVVYGEPIGRLIIKKDVTIYKTDKNGNMKAAGHVKNGSIPFYGVEGDYYNIGKNQYIRYEKDKMVPYNGYVLIRKTTTVYSPNGKKHSTLKAGSTIKVYGEDSKKYQVGNGKYIKKDKHVSYFVGEVKIKKNTTLYKNGKKVKVLKKGEHYRVYSITNNKLNLGSGKYVIADHDYIEYTKN
ncbi:alkaline phosphatase PhoX [Heyndrickxia sp. NPDC080065]|uniref:alkaline phosphatase PhoX n=1 Tax=Heyndrickxia sp. NPDC080065 TaxID=3390568 RepID=UPI003CFE7E46